MTRFPYAMSTASLLLTVLLSLPAAAQPAHVVSRQDLPITTLSSGPGEAVEMDGVLYFAATHPLTGRELWRWDGAGPPSLVADLCPGREGSDPRQPTVFDGRLYFAARRDCGSESMLLYTTDGTPSGTVAVASLGDAWSWQVRRLAATRNALYATQQPGTPLRVLRGSAFVELAPWASSLTPLGDLLFFLGEDENGRELWVSDGTNAGTRRVRDIAPGAASGIEGLPERLFVHRGYLYFVARGESGCGLYASDGTEAGTGFSTAASRTSSTGSR